MRLTGSELAVIQIHPSLRCNLRCLHCYSSSGPDRKGELPYSMLFQALKDARAEGYNALSVSGGEPFLYSSLGLLVRAARDLQFATAVTTNGMLLDERRLSPLAETLDFLTLSLDGVPEAHNRIRGSDRAFERMHSNLELVRSLKLKFGFIFTLTQFNAEQLDWVAAYACENGASLLQIHALEGAGRAVTELVGEEPDDFEESVAWVEAARLRAKYAGQLDIRVDLLDRRVLASQVSALCERPTVNSGTRLMSDLLSPLVIEADGTVVPLEYGFARDFALGNIFDQPLSELMINWRSDGYPRFAQFLDGALRQAAAREGRATIDLYAELRMLASRSVAFA